MPHFLGTEADFTGHFARDITKGHLPGASAREIRAGTEKLKLLHQQVLPFVLRREKGQVLQELPPKTITDIPCAMTPEQAALYGQISTNGEARTAMTVLERYLGCNGKDPFPREADREMGGGTLRALFYLRLLCTHPILVAKSKRSNLRRRKEAEARSSHTLSNDDVYAAEDEFEDEGILTRFDISGKLLALNDLLRTAGIFHDEMTAADNDQSLLYLNDTSTPTVSDGSYDSLTKCFHQDSGGMIDHNDNDNDNGSKCLIFAQFTQSLDIVERSLFQPHMPSLRYVRLDGRVDPKDRTAVVDRFTNDESIRCMLLTTKVGGLGLNLQAADVVIFLESDWNPHVDLQAMDRAHRIGQTKTVNVYRLVTTGTIEEKIMDMQRVKIAMSDAIVNSDNSTMYSMGTDRLLDIFTVNGSGQMEEEERNDHHDMDRGDEEYANFSVEAFLAGYQK